MDSSRAADAALRAEASLSVVTKARPPLWISQYRNQQERQPPLKKKKKKKKKKKADSPKLSALDEEVANNKRQRNKDGERHEGPV